MEEKSIKILFYGDSITDAGWNREVNMGTLGSYGMGYVRSVAGTLMSRNPKRYTIINRGVGGDRVVDLYARIKCDVWNHEPDVLSIMIGVNDVWHDIIRNNGVDIERYEKVYRMIIEDTKKRFPNIKIILCEPFVLKGWSTKDNMQRFSEVWDYAKVVPKLAKEYNCFFLPLQCHLEKKAKEYGVDYYLQDGVHPNVAGAQLIADKWVELFDKEIESLF